jgi:drug/metabolite transporter (DMT)-like permease
VEPVAERSGDGRDATTRVVKAVMVPLWSSGFIVGTLATRHAEALAVTAWRLLAATLLMGAIAVGTRAPWPRRPRDIAVTAVAGFGLQAVQFAGVYLALQQGVPAGLAALLAGTSPVVVAVLAMPLLHERLTRTQWIGAGIGVAGVGLAVTEQLGGTVTVGGFAFAVLGLAGLVGGTLAQRAFGAKVDLRAANTIQLGVGAVVMVPLAALTQGLDIPTTWPTLGPIIWLVAANSILAVLLFFWLLARQKSGEATSFLYLVPAVTALAAVPILGQSLGIGVIAGLVLSYIGVQLVNRPDRIPSWLTRRRAAPSEPDPDPAVSSTGR